MTLTDSTVRHQMGFRENWEYWEIRCSCGYSEMFKTASKASAALVLHPASTFEVKIQ